nr:hypothetical protein [Novosphingobium panipatense]
MIDGDVPDFGFPTDTELLKLYSLAVDGLSNGDLAPLKTYMLAGGAMVGFLAELLVDAMRGEGEYRLEMKAQKRGHRPRDARFAAYQAKQKLGIETLTLLRSAGESCFEAVICEQMAANAVSRATITNALSMVRRELQHEYGEFADLEALVKAFPAEFEPKLTNRSTLYLLSLDRLRPAEEGQSNT